MTPTKFNRPPLSPSEKEKKAEEFIGLLDKNKIEEKSGEITRKLEKEPMKPYPLRIPSSLFDDMKEIAALTGISINAICLELLRPTVKKKLKELKES